MGMMTKGYVWIVSNDIANLFDSVDTQSFSSMKGVIGIKAHNSDTSKSFRKFKVKFRHKYGVAYPEEEEFSNPSFFCTSSL